MEIMREKEVMRLICQTVCLRSWTRNLAAYILGIESVKNSYSDLRMRRLMLIAKIMLLSHSESYIF